jgi:molybdate transport system ATP-binding protein
MRSAAGRRSEAAVLTLEARTPRGDLELQVKLTVDSGECLALAGPSGAGKTTILRIAAGLLRPADGQVHANGTTWLDTERGIDVPAERRRCGYVFQDYALFPHLTAWQNVAYPLRGLSRQERRARAVELLERFGLLSRADARPRSLSGGERQRVAVARALARRPDVLLLDEPLSALDTRSRADAARELGALLRESEAPALLVTHDFAEAAQLGDRVGIIDRGQVIQEGTASELAAAPTSAFVADFTGAVVLTGTARARAGGLTEVALDGGGTVTSVDPGAGPVAVSVYPWEIAIEPAGDPPHGSAQNRLLAEVVSLTTVGNRVRLGLLGPQQFVAEITRESAERLELEPGAQVAATWKAAMTRLMSV